MKKKLFPLKREFYYGQEEVSLGPGDLSPCRSSVNPLRNPPINPPINFGLAAAMNSSITPHHPTTPPPPIRGTTKKPPISAVDRWRWRHPRLIGSLQSRGLKGEQGAEGGGGLKSH